MGFATWLQAQAWKIGAGVASVAALGLGAALVISKIENHRLVEANTKLSKQLEVSRTNLATCRENSKRLDDALTKQNKEVDRVRSEGQRRLAEAEKALKATEKQVSTLTARAGAMLSYHAVGADSCARTADVRRQYQESLK